MPIHMADIGSDNFEQEFTLSLMENDEAALQKIESSLERIEEGRLRQVRRVRGEDFQEPAERHSVRHALREMRRPAGKWALIWAAASWYPRPACFQSECPAKGVPCGQFP